MRVGTGRRWVAVVATVVGLWAPAGASAGLRCVPAPAAGCDSAHATIGAAVDAADDGDAVRIAAGRYEESVSTGKRLVFEGAGSGGAAPATVIESPAGPALELSGGGIVRSLRAVGAADLDGGTGIVLGNVGGYASYWLRDVAAIGGDAQDVSRGAPGPALVAASSGSPIDLRIVRSSFGGGRGMVFGAGVVQLSGPDLLASIDRSSVSGSDNGSMAGLTATGGVTVDVTETAIRAQLPAHLADGKLAIERSRLLAETNGAGSGRTGLLAQDTSDDGDQTRVALDDSLVTLAPVLVDDSSYVVLARTLAGGDPVSVRVRGSTLIGRSTQRAVDGRYEQPQGIVGALRADGAPTAAVDLRNTVARMAGSAAARIADLVADRGVVTASHSAFASSVEMHGGSAPVPGSDANVAGAPMLDANLVPMPGSPLVDAGDLAAVTGDLDLAGEPRSADGDGDGVAEPDIGAFELQPPPDEAEPPPAESGDDPHAGDERPVVSRVSAPRQRFRPVRRGAPRHRRGTAIRFTLSERARVRVGIHRVARLRALTVRQRRRCRALRRRGERPRICRRRAGVGAIAVRGSRGRNVVTFSGRLRGRPLRPGRYVAVLVAIDRDGDHSRPRRLGLRVLSG